MSSTLRNLTIGGAAECFGVGHACLWRLRREGKVGDVKTAACRHRCYMPDDLWKTRQTLETNVKKSRTCLSGCRAGDAHEVVPAMSLKQMEEVGQEILIPTCH